MARRGQLRHLAPDHILLIAAERAVGLDLDIDADMMDRVIDDAELAVHDRVGRRPGGLAADRLIAPGPGDLAAIYDVIRAARGDRDVREGQACLLYTSDAADE